MQTNKHLQAIGEMLRSVGYNVEEFPNGIRIKLPFFCSVRLISQNGDLVKKPYFGAISREYATYIVITLYSLCVVQYGIYLMVGGTDIVKLAYFIMVLAILGGGLIWDVFRYFITERCLNDVEYVSRNDIGKGRKITGS